MPRFLRGAAGRSPLREIHFPRVLWLQLRVPGSRARLGTVSGIGALGLAVTLSGLVFMWQRLLHTWLGQQE